MFRRKSYDLPGGWSTYSGLKYHAPVTAISTGYSEIEGETRTVSCQGLLVPRLPVAKPVHPVVDRVDRLVIEVFPAGMLESLQRVESGAWRQQRLGQYTVGMISSEDVPGHKPTIRPSSLPALYHERHFAAYTD